LPRIWAEQLINDFRDKEILLIGYAGIDPDIRPTLIEGLKGSKFAFWFELPHHCNALNVRYFNLIQVGKLKIVSSKNPSLSFLQKMTEYGFTNSIPEKLINFVSQRDFYNVRFIKLET